MKPRGSSSAEWPAPMGEAAFIGIVGDIVAAIAPISEADSAALLVQLLVAFGNAAGRGWHSRAEADRHGLNLFALIVGDTAKGRKGTSWGQIRSLMREAEPAWSEQAIHNGLSSAEGLISLVQDTAIGSHSDPGASRVSDPDKRALIIESEFASVLNVMKRQGNNLSEVLRNAWDGNKLETITKHTPLKATSAHISLIGHVTSDELLLKVQEVELSNGFLNRFLMVMSTRSKTLPHGGRLSGELLQSFARRLRATIAKCRDEREMLRDGAATALWEAIYPALSEGHRDRFGGVVSRSEAQVVRLSCVYAALDGSHTVRAVHLQAALAVWRYAEDSAAFLFPGRFGSKLANGIYAQLRRSPAGMTTTDIYRFLSNHGEREELEAALGVLVTYGVAYSIEERSGGRPAIRWHAK